MSYLNREIEKNLLKSATDPELVGVLKDYTEVGIDAIFKSELVDAIPVVKSIAALIKGVISVQDRIFLKKLAHFLSNANNMTMEERDAWYDRHINGNEEVEKQLADKLLIMVDAVNDNYKADVIGKLFMAFVKGDINTLDHFYYMCELVENCYTNILKGLSEGKQMNDDALFRSGIKHASTPTGKDINDMLSQDTLRARRGMSSSSQLPYRSASYTAAGELLIRVLKTY